MPPPHARTPSSALSRAQEYAFIKRAVGAEPVEGEVYAELEMRAGDTVARLAARACKEFKRWAVDADQLRLFLVNHPHDADEPPSAEEEKVVTELTRPHWALPRAGVGPGSWLLARVPAPAAPAGASCVGPPTAP